MRSSGYCGCGCYGSSGICEATTERRETLADGSEPTGGFAGGGSLKDLLVARLSLEVKGRALATVQLDF